MTASPAKVAILVRTKNRPITLIRALDSIIRQTMTDWHIHLLNDGGDSAVVRETAQHYSAQLSGKITFYDNEKSLGRGGALAQLLRASTEEYALIHDDDDTLEPEFLAETVSFLDHEKNSDCSAVVTGNIDVDATIEDNNVIIHSINSIRGSKENSYIDIISFLKAKLGKFPPIACLFKLKDSLPFLDIIEKTEYHEDKLLFSYMLLKGDFATIDKQLSHYYHYKSKGNSYSQTDASSDTWTLRESNNHFRSGFSSEKEINKAISFLQNGRVENENIKYLLLEVNKSLTQNIASMRDDMNQSMKSICEILQHLSDKVDRLQK